jgi:hypothetical protein
MTAGQFWILTAWIYLTGGTVDEFVFDDSIKWYSFSVNLTDTQATLLANNYTLTDSIFLNVPLTIVDEDDVPVSNAPAASATSSAKRAESRKDETAENSHNGTEMVKRVSMNDVMITEANGTPTDWNIQFWPFHLQWLSNLWAKNNLAGNCECEYICNCFPCFFFWCCLE